MKHLTLIATIALGVALDAAPALAQPTPEEVQLLGRLGYGHDDWTLRRLRAVGVDAYIDEQLNPSRVPDGEVVGVLRDDPAFDAWRMQLPELFAAFGNQQGQRRPGVLLQQIKNELLLRAIVGHRQVEALLTEFWFNHFNVDMGGTALNHVVPYVRDTLRPRVLGKFEDLLLSVARSPAMLIYLNNDDNFRDGFVRGGRVVGLNENYARELLELHTLGTGDQSGVYTQRDVTEAARCLTGWSANRDGFRFVAAGHDDGAKRVMRLSLPAGGGEQDGVALVQHLARHPRTARHLCGKLVRFFVGTGQSDLIGRAVQEWTATEGDLRAVMRVILSSPELRAAAGSKVKRPSLLLTSALRAVEADLSDPTTRFALLSRLSQACTALGQDLYQVEPPTGWTDANGTFVSEGTMLQRFSRLNTLCTGANRFASKYDPQHAVDANLVRALGDRLLGQGRLSPETQAAVEGYLGGLQGTVPAVVRTRGAMALVLSSPDFGTY